VDFKNISSIYERLLRGLLFFLVIFIPYREVISLFVSPRVKLLPDLMILFVFALYLIKNKFKIKLNSSDIYYGIFLALAFISSIVINHVGIKSYIIQTRSIFVYYILYFMLRHTHLSVDFYKGFSKVIFYNTTILVSLSVVEKITNKLVFFPYHWAKSIEYADNFARIYGTFNNPNTFAAYLLFSTIIMFYLERVMAIKINKGFYVLSITGIILTASRSTMISLGAFLLISILIFKSLDVVKNFGVTIIISILMFFCINNLNRVYTENFMDNESKIPISIKNGNSVVNRFGELADDVIISQSKNDGRVFSILKGIEIFKQHPILGTGFGTYGDAASLIIPPKQYSIYGIREDFYADNEYIKVLVETGLLGSIVYGLFLLSIINKNKHNKLKLLATFILGFIGMFYNIFEVQILSFLYWTLLTLPEGDLNNKQLS
jgi:putative inorganic carbon (hco3(-)) transporter